MRDLHEDVAAIFAEASEAGEKRFIEDGFHVEGKTPHWSWRPDVETRRAVARQDYAKRTKSLRPKRPVYKVTPDGRPWRHGAPATEAPPPTTQKRGVLFWHQIEAAARLVSPYK